MSRLIWFPSDALDRALVSGPRPVAQHSLPSDPERRRRAIGEAIERVVLDSYEKHPMAHRTAAEDLRRATICTDWFTKLVSGYRWTHDRALSAMRHVLDDALSGRAPSVERQRQERFWVPDKTLVRSLA